MEKAENTKSRWNKWVGRVWGNLMVNWEIYWVILSKIQWNQEKYWANEPSFYSMLLLKQIDLGR